MVRVAVLGHRGMLGSVVARYFAEQGAEVCTTDLRYLGSDAVPEWATQHDVVVNCIRSADNDPVVNGFLPIHLAAFRREDFGGLRPVVVQPSTDAIDEDTAYARVKRMGDRVDGCIIRAGIVDVGRQPVRAYTNWYSNPITPLEWAEAAWNDRYRRGVREVGGHAIDRWTLACLVARIWGRPMPEPVEAEASNVRLVKTTTDRPMGLRLERFKEWLDKG